MPSRRMSVSDAIEPLHEDINIMRHDILAMEERLGEPKFNDSVNMLAEAMRRAFSETFEPLRKDINGMRGDMLAMEERLNTHTEWEDLRGCAPDATGVWSSEAFVRRLRDDWEHT